MPSRIPKQAGKHSISPDDRREIIDLYVWGARVKDIEMIYNVSKFTLAYFLNQNGVPRRMNGKTPFASTKREDLTVRSNRPLIPEGAVFCSDPSRDADLLIRSFAHEQRDKRIAEHQLGASTYSCPEAAA